MIKFNFTKIYNLLIELISTNRENFNYNFLKIEKIRN